MASEALILEMLMNPPPNLHEPLPLSNRRATIYGASITFMIITWFAVALRLYARIKLVRKPGWDDILVVVSSMLNTAATICVLFAVESGMGQHFLTLVPKQQTQYIKTFYIANGIYVTNTAVIKVSLLLQYLRIFQAGTMRWICLSLVVMITAWGFAYGFMAWVPCFPVHAYWNRLQTPNARCYAYGFDSVPSFIVTFETHTATNMTFDLAVFLTPMALFKQKSMRRKSMLALVGLFLFGGVVVLTSVWRLYTIVNNKAATYPYIDFTWWTPISVILSCLEIDLAIVCASMPIFWPVLEKSLTHIFVTYEVRITEHRRLPENGEYELERADAESTRRSGSLKSGSGNSEDGLTITRTQTRNGTVDPFMHYKDQYVIEQVDPLATNHGVETNVETEPKKKWNF